MPFVKMSKSAEVIESVESIIPCLVCGRVEDDDGSLSNWHLDVANKKALCKLHNL